MSKRVLVVADQEVMPAVKRYVRYFIGSAIVPLVRPEIFAEDYRCFHLQPPSDESRRHFNLQHYTSVYFWGLYDHILLQDTFVLKHENVEGLKHQNLEELDSSPLCVAHHLLYARGQFGAARSRTVFPIILDPRLLARTALSDRLDKEMTGKWLSGPLQQDRARLREALDPHGFWGDFISSDAVKNAEEEPGSLFLPLSGRTGDEIKNIVRCTIRQGNLRLLWIDDNPDWLRIPYEALGGTNFPPKAASETDGFWVLRSCTQGQAPVMDRVSSFEKLRAVLSEFSRSPEPGLRVIVTDILFGRGSEVTGLDILRYVRGEDQETSPRNVLMAFTGYGSPLVTATCHGEGADFVVKKGGADHHGHTSEHGNKPSTPPVIEMFWNMLWLRAATWFTGERLEHLQHDLLDSPKSSAMTPVDAKRVVERALRDIDAVFPPHESLKCFTRLRHGVFEALTEAAEYAHVRFDARGQDAKELGRWRTRLGERLNDVSSRFLPKGEPSGRP